MNHKYEFENANNLEIKWIIYFKLKLGLENCFEMESMSLKEKWKVGTTVGDYVWNA